MKVCDLLEKVYFRETDESMQKFTVCCIAKNSIKYIPIHMSKLLQMAFHKKLYANEYGESACVGMSVGRHCVLKFQTSCPCA